MTGSWFREIHADITFPTLNSIALADVVSLIDRAVSCEVVAVVPLRFDIDRTGAAAPPSMHRLQRRLKAEGTSFRDIRACLFDGHARRSTFARKHDD